MADMRKTIFLTGVVLFLAFLAVSSIKQEIVQAAISENVTGWLWGGSEDQDMAGSGGVFDGNETGFGWTAMNNVDENGAVIFPGASFGVSIPQVDGLASGYAWNGNLGWISFNASDLVGCPEAPCTARRVGNRLEGWARIVGVKEEADRGNSGGWRGFIKLYGINIDSNGEITGYGWNGENNDDPPVGRNIANGLGWIEFRAKVKAIQNSCVGSIPSGSVMCHDDDIDLTLSLPWQSVGDSSAGCTFRRKCEYYTSASCTPDPRCVDPDCSGLCGEQSRTCLDLHNCPGSVTCSPACGTFDCGPCPPDYWREVRP